MILFLKHCVETFIEYTVQWRWVFQRVRLAYACILPLCNIDLNEVYQEKAEKAQQQVNERTI